MGNKIEKLPLKKRVVGGVVSGLFYALTMAGFDYYDDQTFSLSKFLFHSLFFGFIMSFVFKYSARKKTD